LSGFWWQPPAVGWRRRGDPGGGLQLAMQGLCQVCKTVDAMEYGAVHALFQGARGIFGFNRCAKGCTEVVRCTMGARQQVGWRLQIAGFNWMDVLDV